MRRGGGRIAATRRTRCRRRSRTIGRSSHRGLLDHVNGGICEDWRVHLRDGDVIDDFRFQFLARDDQSHLRGRCL